MKTMGLLFVAGFAASFAGCSKAVPRVVDGGRDLPGGLPVGDAPVADAPKDMASPRDRYLGDRSPIPDAPAPAEDAPTPWEAPDAALAWVDDFDPASPLDWFISVGGWTSWSVTAIGAQGLLSQGIADPMNWTIAHSKRQFAKNQIIDVRLRITERSSATSLSQVVVFGRYDSNMDRGIGVALRGDGAAVLRKRERGLTSSYRQATPVSLALSDWHQVRLELVGGDLAAFVDGVLVATAEETDPAVAEGSVALGCVGAIAEFDWVSVTSW